MHRGRPPRRPWRCVGEGRTPTMPPSCLRSPTSTAPKWATACTQQWQQQGWGDPRQPDGAGPWSLLLTQLFLRVYLRLFLKV
jgi:hypothetical protein